MKRTVRLASSLILTLTIIGVVSCSPKTKPVRVVEVIKEVPAPIKPTVDVVSEANFELPVAENEIKVMAYNVENLFDTERDEKNEDYEYLPKDHPAKEKCATVSKSYRQLCYETDWNAERLKIKIEQLARVVEAQGPTPDFIGLQEVENDTVVKMLGERLGYTKYYVSQGPDKRGIEVAMLYKEDKMEFISQREILVKGIVDNSFEDKPTRNILAAYFKVKATSDILGFYVNHWPSQAAPGLKRTETAINLQRAMDEDYKKYGEKFHTVALGDFNTVPTDNPHPFREVVLNPEWKNKMTSVNDAFSNDTSDEARDARKHMPRGTYFYYPNLEWNFLDYIFVGKKLVDGVGLEVVPQTFRIVAPRFSSEAVTTMYLNQQGEVASRSFLTPMKFNRKTVAPGHVGASDHYPVVVKLRIL